MSLPEVRIALQPVAYVERVYGRWPTRWVAAYNPRGNDFDWITWRSTEHTEHWSRRGAERALRKRHRNFIRDWTAKDRRITVELPEVRR